MQTPRLKQLSTQIPRRRPTRPHHRRRPHCCQLFWPIRVCSIRIQTQIQIKPIIQIETTFLFICIFFFNFKDLMNELFLEIDENSNNDLYLLLPLFSK